MADDAANIHPSPCLTIFELHHLRNDFTTGFF